MRPSLVLYRVSRDRLAEKAEELLANGFRLALVAAHDDGDRLRIVYLFLAGRPDRRIELECIVPASDPALPSLAYLSFPASRFEREMLDLYGIRPIGHPRQRRGPSGQSSGSLAKARQHPRGRRFRRRHVRDQIQRRSARQFEEQ